MDKINDIIMQKLSEIEEKENVHILHCAESGSRAWGFASPDSDYDVRFIYVRPAEFYLKLENTSDVIEWQLDDTLDINGWDIQKALRLLYKSNPTLFEWKNSPIIYKTTDKWIGMNDTINEYFNIKSAVYHYLNTAKNNYKPIMHTENVKLKKYFYILRPILACKWVLDKKTPPPVLFSQLVEAELEEKMLPQVNALLEAKAVTSEMGTSKRIEPLNDYIDKQMEDIQMRLDSLEQTPNSGWDKLNDLFISVIKKSF
ncbi:MAG: nucleotidyltransferase domain-containing protein [Oscillospiraceae bacterium]|nr:nucleotidyltransferase domain-containing protein [Oscillospiraceae bacterium]